MGKFGPRLSSRKKAKRWPKGQSSSSNPETRKYRNQARSCFFQPNLGLAGLTISDVKKHDALQGIPPKPEEDVEMDNDGTESSVGASTFKTFDTFASDWSECSNISFSRFLNHFQSNSAIHKEMLAVLAAITEVIKQNGGKETSTEYFAALMTTLESAETEECISATLSLLGMGMKTVPKNVLRHQFSHASLVFIQILMKYASEENFLILRHCIGCLSVLLRIQEAAAWSNSDIFQILDAILAFTVHSKPKVRKAAQHAICSLLKGSDIMRSDNPPPYHPAAPQIAKHCLAQLETAGQPGQITSTLHILTLLKDIAHQLPKSSVKSLCEGLLSIMTLNNILITSCCFQTFYGLFVSKPTEAILPSQLNAQIINALYDYQPAPGDSQPTLAWLAVMQEAYCNLVQHSPELCMINLPRIVEKCKELWLTDKTDVLTGASHTLKALLELCVAPVCENKELIPKCKPMIVKVIDIIKDGLEFKYTSAWKHVLHLLASIYKIIGPICQEELVDILIKLSDLRDSYKFSYNTEVEYAVGAAIRSLGPQVVLTAIPLTNSEGDVDLKRSWILPVLKETINNGSLGYFIENLHPLAKLCEEKWKVLQGNNDKVGAHSNYLLMSQIWALLPSFCSNPPDIPQNFPKIAKILGTIIRENKDLRSMVMTSLRKLIQKSIDNDNKTDMETLVFFAKNFLPILLNVYIIEPENAIEESQRSTCFETIKAFSKLSLKTHKTDLIGELFDNALERFNKPDNSNFLKEKLFDLLINLCQHADVERVEKLYNKCIPLLMDKKHMKEQKKAYRFLEEICGSETEVCKQFLQEKRKDVQKLLTKKENLMAVLPVSKGPRIRCITHLVEIHPQLEKTNFLKKIVPEAVLYIREQNEKCRQSSFTLLNTIAEKFINKEEDLKEYMEILKAGLGGDPSYCSASLLALSSILFHYNGSLGVHTVHEILDLTCDLVKSQTREVAQSALSFIKVYISVMPKPIIGPTIKKIVESISNMVEDCKRHSRQKVRDIIVKLVRKFGVDTITSMVPASDKIMQKRLKNIRKIETRKQKLKDNKDKDEESDEEFSIKKKPKSLEEILADSDDDFDGSDNDEPKKLSKRKSTKKTWITDNEDNIVDFVDPTSAKNISTTKPSASIGNAIIKKAKDHGFKTAPDGRLIIVDESDDDSDDEKTKNKKNKLSFLNSDDEDDDDDDDFKSLKSAKSAKSVKSAKSSKSNVLQRKRKLSDVSDDNSDSKSFNSKYKAGGSGIHRPLKMRKQEKRKPLPGEEYRAKKAFGDVKLKNQPDPYAYIPLRRSVLNRRKKMKNAKELKKVLSGSKKDKNLRKNSRNKKKM